MLTTIGFAGLGVSRLVADRFFGGEHEFMRTRFGYVIVMIFVSLFLVGGVVLLPTATLIRRRKMPEARMTIYPWWDWVLLVPYFYRDNDAKVPRWIWMPIFAFGFLLALVLLIIFATFGILWLLALHK